MKNEGVSIIITAYDTANYIEECLDSIYAQTWFKKAEEWEVLVGIDHCEKTLGKMKDIMYKYPNLRVFYMTENVGTYVTSNTLISKAKYNKILRFDSDDIMKENMVESMIEAMDTVSKTKIVLCYFETFPKKDGKSSKSWAHGVFLCKKSVYTKYGGFMPWKCAADTEFLTRLKNEDVPVTTFPLVLFYYRMHEKSLTKNKETSMQSDLRKGYKKYVEKTSPHTPVIKTVTAPCDEIKAESVKSEVILPITETETQIENTRPKYVKRIVSYAKTIRKTAANTYTGV